MFLVTPNYFKTVGQTLLRGRAFNDADDGRNHAVIVNRALAQHEWPGENSIGHRIFSGDLKAWATVVGEVGDVHSYSLDRTPVPNLYLPEADGPDTSMTIFLRTSSDPSDMDEAVRRLLRGNSGLTVRYIESMPELMAHAVAMRQFSMWVVVAFGLMALVLATLGTYALLAYEVSLREREIGIRLALGSQRWAILALLIRQESQWIGVGLGLGLLGAILTGYLLRAEFYHAGAASAPVLATALALLAFSALAAVAIPLSGRIGQRNTGRAGGSGHSQEEVLHLRGEFATRGFLAGKTICPIEEAAGITGGHDLVQEMVLIARYLVSVQN